MAIAAFVIALFALGLAALAMLCVTVVSAELQKKPRATVQPKAD